MENELAADNRIAKIHQQHEFSGRAVRADTGSMRHDGAVGPMRVLHFHAVDAFYNEMNLMDVEIVNLSRCVKNVPLLNGPRAYDEHRRSVHGERFAVDEEMLRLLTEYNPSGRNGARQGLRVRVLRKRCTHC